MKIKEVKARSLLRKYKKIDSWFVSRYGMNIYRGCAHACAYCDGRAENYFVSGEFGEEIEVKINAPQLLRQELNPARKKVPLKKGLILPSGGVGDSYQPAEAKYQMMPKILEIIDDFGYGVHILTKSSLIERDLDIISEINQKTRAIVSFSFSSTRNEISKIFEPRASTPSSRLNSISKFKKRGVICGMALLPVIPFVTDKPEIMEQSVRDAKNAGVDFVLFGAMTLKQGQQMEHFLSVLENYHPGLHEEYFKIYYDARFGTPESDYIHQINSTFSEICAHHKIPRRIPAKFFNKFIDRNDLVIVILDQIDYLLKSAGRKSSYGWAAHNLSQLKEPIDSINLDLARIPGVGPFTKKLIKEILRTGTCKYYENLMHH